MAIRRQGFGRPEIGFFYSLVNPKMKHLLLILCVMFSFRAAYSETPPPALSQQSRDQALSAIKKWSGFDGTWEGELKYQVAPRSDWYQLRIPFKVVINGNEQHIFVRQGIENWSEIGATIRTSQPDELTLVVHTYGSSGVWTENNLVVITRRTEHTADVFVQRVVNNWAGTPSPGEDLVYGDTRSGKVRREIGG